MLVKDAMTKKPLSARADATIQEIAAGMREADVGSLPVVADDEQLVGIVTDRDLAVRALADGFGPETRGWKVREPTRATNAPPCVNLVVPDAEGWGGAAVTRDERVAKNCVVFRELNERIVRGAHRAGFEGPTVFACECGDVECSEAIEVPLGRYEQARSRSTVFLVATGHELPGMEEVLEENEHFLIVELVGAGVAIAERYDPRA